MSLQVEPPAPGYTVQGRDGESCGPAILVANSVTMTFAVIGVVLRMIVKSFIVRKIQWEDYLVVLALLFSIGQMAIYIIRRYLHVLCT